MPPEPGSTLRKAREISIIDVSRTFKNSLSRTDRIDIYRFRSSAPNQCKLTLNGLQGNANLALLDRSGELLARSRRPSQLRETIAIDLNAGTYYLRVSLEGNISTRYTLQAAAAPLPPSTPSSTPLPTPLPTPSPSSPSQIQQVWIKQFGTASDDAAFAVAVSRNQNVYIAGNTDGSLGGSNAGSLDPFVAKYNSAGDAQWTRQGGTVLRDSFNDLEVDSSENIYATGTVFLPDSLVTILNDGDAYLAKYNSNGDLLFDQGFDVGNGSSELAYGVALSNDNTIHMVGSVAALGSDGFITRYDSSGTLNSQQQMNLSGEGLATGVATDASGSVYVTGITDASLAWDPNNPLANGDVFIARYDTNGQPLWFKTLATDQTDVASRVAVDASGNIYVAGGTSGSLPGYTNQGGIDPFVAKFASDGSLQWVKQIGTLGTDSAETIAIDTNGRIYVAGSTTGALFGNHAGASDAWIAMFDSNGNLTTSTQFGTSGDERLTDIALDSIGGLYTVGTTDNSLGGSHSGAIDAWVARYTIVTP